jgi:hypothetical protein
MRVVISLVSPASSFLPSAELGEGAREICLENGFGSSLCYTSCTAHRDCGATEYCSNGFLFQQRLHSFCFPKEECRDRDAVDGKCPCIDTTSAECGTTTPGSTAAVVEDEDNNSASGYVLIVGLMLVHYCLFLFESFRSQQFQ